MGFSTEKTDFLWWLMVSNDTNAVRLVLSVLDSASWREDIPRLVRGLTGRQKRGRWDTTVANAWGVLAMEKFSKAFERVRCLAAVQFCFQERRRPRLECVAQKAAGLTFPGPRAGVPFRSTLPPREAMGHDSKLSGHPLETTLCNRVSNHQDIDSG